MNKTLACSALAFAALTGTASAVPMAGLTEDGMLVTFDSDAAALQKMMPVSGVGGKLIGIDVRPTDGKLYGVSTNNQIYTIDLATGAAAAVSALSQAFPASKAAVVDFNPAADRLRLMSSDGTNYRINVDTGAVTVDGTLKFDSSDMHAGKTPMVTGGAYTNSFAGTKETALYNIEGTTGTLVLQAPPNDGVLKSKGILGAPTSGMAALDIMSDGKGANMAFGASGKSVYTVNLETGAAGPARPITGLTGNLIDIAVLPSKM